MKTKKPAGCQFELNPKGHCGKTPVRTMSVFRGNGKVQIYDLCRQHFDAAEKAGIGKAAQ